jgi:hypothetical protein
MTTLPFPEGIVAFTRMFPEGGVRTDNGSHVATGGTALVEDRIGIGP